MTGNNMKAIRSNAEQVLRENYNSCNDPETSFREYVDCTSQSDPGFFRWLFDEEFNSDFDSDLTEEQNEMFQDFLNSIND